MDRDKIIDAVKAARSVYYKDLTKIMETEVDRKSSDPMAIHKMYATLMTSQARLLMEFTQSVLERLLLSADQEAE